MMPGNIHCVELLLTFCKEIHAFFEVLLRKMWAKVSSTTNVLVFDVLFALFRPWLLQR